MAASWPVVTIPSSTSSHRLTSIRIQNRKSKPVSSPPPFSGALMNLDRKNHRVKMREGSDHARKIYA
jgi:hypothetical protein